MRGITKRLAFLGTIGWLLWLGFLFLDKGWPSGSDRFFAWGVIAFLLVNLHALFGSMRPEDGAGWLQLEVEARKATLKKKIRDASGE